VLRRATKPAKELIAQNPPQDCLQSRATSGLVFAKQAEAAEVAGGGSSWQQAGSGRKQAGLVTWQGTRQGAKMARNAKCAYLLLWYSVARGRQQVIIHRQVESARASPLAFSPVAGQPHHFSDFPKNGEKCELRVFCCYGTRSRVASSRRNTHRQVGSARATPLAFLSALLLVSTSGHSSKPCRVLCHGRDCFIFIWYLF